MTIDKIKAMALQASSFIVDDIKGHMLAQYGKSHTDATYTRISYSKASITLAGDDGRVTIPLRLIDSLSINMTKALVITLP